MIGDDIFVPMLYYQLLVQWTNEDLVGLWRVGSSCYQSWREIFSWLERRANYFCSTITARLRCVLVCLFAFIFLITQNCDSKVFFLHSTVITHIKKRLYENPNKEISERQWTKQDLRRCMKRKFLVKGRQDIRSPLYSVVKPAMGLLSTTVLIKKKMV